MGYRPRSAIIHPSLESFARLLLAAPSARTTPRATLALKPTRENGELVEYRRAPYGVWLVSLVLLSLVLLVSMVLFDQREAYAAQNPHVVVSAALAQERFGCPEEGRPFEAGGSLCVSDWVAYLPLAILSALIVIVVDGFALFIILRRRRRGEEFA